MDFKKILTYEIKLNNWELHVFKQGLMLIKEEGELEKTTLSNIYLSAEELLKQLEELK